MSRLRIFNESDATTVITETRDHALIAELLARVKALLRRAELLQAAQANAQTQASSLRNGDLEILPVKRLVQVRGKSMDFTALEFDLLLTPCGQNLS